MVDTRERIRAAALKLFVEQGYRQTSIAAIEAASGLAPRTGGFYRHYSSKDQLAAEICELQIIETSADLGFGGVLPLGDTRAELVLIAKGYAKAFDRQAPLEALIAEVRHLPEIRELEGRVDVELTELLTGWLKGKSYAAALDEAGLTVLMLTVFGGWIFFLAKRGSPAGPPGLDDQFVLDQWADFWSGVLDA
ncbi:MAG: TetR/AcrR family transcriptional regulator [Chloroflexi bacterium]|nr:TetR/AcrR family transcriptional regulator [Chloroflexota bacterium]MDA1145262.1 TetR/AcrR family transcriptional regulator [Chloroflexota bacterium]